MTCCQKNSGTIGSISHTCCKFDSIASRVAACKPTYKLECGQTVGNVLVVHCKEDDNYDEPILSNCAVSFYGCSSNAPANVLAGHTCIMSFPAKGITLSSITYSGERKIVSTNCSEFTYTKRAISTNSYRCQFDANVHYPYTCTIDGVTYGGWTSVNIK